MQNVIGPVVAAVDIYYCAKGLPIGHPDREPRFIKRGGLVPPELYGRDNEAEHWAQGVYVDQGAHPAVAAYQTTAAAPLGGDEPKYPARFVPATLEQAEPGDAPSVGYSHPAVAAYQATAAAPLGGDEPKYAAGVVPAALEQAEPDDAPSVGYSHEAVAALLGSGSETIPADEPVKE